MSRSSLFARGTLALSVVFSIGLIAYVHRSQELEQARLHEGVLADLERQQRKQLEAANNSLVAGGSR